MNNVSFKYTLWDKIFSKSIFTLLIFFVLSILLYELDLFIRELQTIGSFHDLIFTLGLYGGVLLFIAYCLYSAVKYMIKDHRYMSKFPEYKVIFSNYHINTINDIMEISQGQLGNTKQVKQHMNHYINNRNIKGIRLYSDEIRYVDDYDEF